MITKKRKRKGVIIAVGGHENKNQNTEIIDIITQKTLGGTLVVLPIGSEVPDEMIAMYKGTFRKSGIKHLYFLKLDSREDSQKKRNIRIIKNAGGIFFTGGDQHKINSLIANTPVGEAIYDVYNNGGVIAGTSAGASVLSETMLVSANKDDDWDNNEFSMAPGMGLLPRNIIIDQHFSQRNRFGRLLNAVAKNPELIAIGLDENTAIVIDQGKNLSVAGEGLVYIFDGSNIKFTDVKDTAFNICASIMTKGYEYDLQNRVQIVRKNGKNK